MLTRISDFLHRHEPITKLLLRIALLLILGSVALDFHFLTLDVGDIADRIDQMQEDIAAMRDNGEDGGDTTATPTRTAIKPRSSF